MIGKYISRIFRNNWGLKINLKYFLYHQLCKLTSTKLKITAREKASVKEAHRNGLAIIDKVDVMSLSEKASRYFENKIPENGLAKLSKQEAHSLAEPIYETIRSLHGAIAAYYGSHFKINWVEIQKIVPGEQPRGSSFSYHTDDSPYSLAKVFVYLVDTYQENGAFRAFDYQWSDKFIKEGILKTTQPGAMRDSMQYLVTEGHEKSLRVIEGEKGTAFIFDNNLVHKGTLPLQGFRIHLVMEIMPSNKDFTFEDVALACSKEITEYYTADPFVKGTEQQSLT
jgi:hypothetical protein